MCGHKIRTTANVSTLTASINLVFVAMVLAQAGFNLVVSGGVGETSPPNNFKTLLDKSHKKTQRVPGKC